MGRHRVFRALPEGRRAPCLLPKLRGRWRQDGAYGQDGARREVGASAVYPLRRPLSTPLGRFDGARAHARSWGTARRVYLVSVRVRVRVRARARTRVRVRVG